MLPFIWDTSKHTLTQLVMIRKTTMKLKPSHLFLLLASTIPTVLIPGHAGAVSSPNSSFHEVKSSVNFASNTAEKLNQLVLDDLLVAKRNIHRDTFKEVVPKMIPTTETHGIEASRPSAADTLNSLLNGDNLG